MRIESETAKSACQRLTYLGTGTPRVREGSDRSFFLQKYTADFLRRMKLNTVFYVNTSDTNICKTGVDQEFRLLARVSLVSLFSVFQHFEKKSYRTNTKLVENALLLEKSVSSNVKNKNGRLIKATIRLFVCVGSPVCVS